MIKTLTFFPLTHGFRQSITDKWGSYVNIPEIITVSNTDNCPKSQTHQFNPPQNYASKLNLSQIQPVLPLDFGIFQFYNLLLSEVAFKNIPIANIYNQMVYISSQQLVDHGLTVAPELFNVVHHIVYDLPLCGLKGRSYTIRPRGY